MHTSLSDKLKEYFIQIEKKNESHDKNEIK